MKSGIITVNLTWGGGALTLKDPKKSWKLWFFASCDTLTSIQPWEKLQLTKVVSSLKKFDHYPKALRENRNFMLQKCLSDALLPPQVWAMWGAQVWNSALMNKNKFCLILLEWRPNIFRSERTLVRCIFSLGWILVKVSLLLQNHDGLQLSVLFGDIRSLSVRGPTPHVKVHWYIFT